MFLIFFQWLWVPWSWRRGCCPACFTQPCTYWGPSLPDLLAANDDCEMSLPQPIWQESGILELEARVLHFLAGGSAVIRQLAVMDDLERLLCQLSNLCATSAASLRSDLAQLQQVGAAALLPSTPCVCCVFLLWPLRPAGRARGLPLCAGERRAGGTSRGCTGSYAYA